MAGRRSALIGEIERGEISPTGDGVQYRAKLWAVRTTRSVR